MNVLKTTKMNSKILMFMLLAYFLVNLSTARPQEEKPKSLDRKNTPAQSKKTLVPNQPIKIHPSVVENFKVNPVVPSATSPSLAKTSVPPASLTKPSAAKFQPSIKNQTLPPSKASTPTTVPTNENENHQGFGIVEDGGDDYEEEDDEDDEEEEELLENSKTVTSQPMLSSSTSKPTVPESVNQENDNHQGFGMVEDERDDYEEEEEEEEEYEDYKEPLENSKTVTSQPMLSSSTSKPTVPESVNQEYDNHQGFGMVEDEGDDYEDEEEEEDDDYEDYKEPLENSKTLTSQPMLSSPTSKPTVPESVNQENDNHQGFGMVEDEGADYEEEEEEEDDDYEDYKEPLENSRTLTSQPMLSSSTSEPTVLESVNQENDNHQGFGMVEDEGADYEEEEEEEDDDYEDYKEPLENSRTLTSQPMLSSSTSEPTVLESVNQENDNHQGFGMVEDEGADYEEEEEEEDDDYEDYKEPLENSRTLASTYKSKQSLSMKINDSSNKFQTSQPMLSSSTSEPTVLESVNQENDKHQGFKTLEGGDDEKVPEENEYGHLEHLEDQNHKTPIDYIMINGIQIPMNNFISTVPQLSEDELTENNYNESKYPLNADEDHQASYYYDELEPKSSNCNNNPTEISETLNRKNDNTKDQSIKTNEFELNSNDSTQIFTDKQENTKEDQFKNQYVTENKERIVDGYKTMKKILYMLHDYASSIFNWIINKIDYRMEQVSS